jgi:integrase
VTTFERPAGSGRWVAKFELRRRQVWVPGGPWPTKRKAQQAEARHRELIARRRSEETCESFAERWLEEWPRPSVETRAIYARASRRFAAEFGATRLGEVERLSARTWALGVPRNISKTIATMYEDARNVGLVDDNPFANLRLPNTERTQEVHPPSLEEFRQLLDACTVLGGYGPEFRALVTFAGWSGMRIGELAALRFSDVDGDFIHVRRARKNDGSIGLPKNGKRRKIAYLEPARVLDQVPRRQGSGSDYVFHSQRGLPLTKNNHHYSWRAVRAAAGIVQTRQRDGVPALRFHDLRHFCATQLLELGLSHFDVSIQLGHEDGGALVMARYGHPSKERARDRLLAAFRPELSLPRSSARSEEVG